MHIPWLAVETFLCENINLRIRYFNLYYFKMDFVDIFMIHHCSCPSQVVAEGDVGYVGLIMCIQDATMHGMIMTWYDAVQVR